MPVSRDIGPQDPPRQPFWTRSRIRASFVQVGFVALVGLVVYFLLSNTMENLSRQGIASGFGFLDQRAGFDVSIRFLAFDRNDTYLRAFWTAVVNTLVLAALGILLATIIGFLLGLARVSPNWLISRLATAYIETFRNIPLLLQLFFWYTVITQLLPAVREALNLLPGVVLSKSGLQFPSVIYEPAQLPVYITFAISVVAAFVYRSRMYKRQRETGQEPKLLLPMLGIMLLPALAVFFIMGAPLQLDVPTFQTFNYRGGSSVTPEFLALLVGLSFYTGGFIAEIVRSGILGVPWGQSEASAALGFRRGLQLRLIILPQALRIIIPPTTSNYLNLTKNSSLAVAIGYPDLVSVGNTTLNQTGQALECIAIMMAVYLTISLLISAYMNWYNRRIALVER